ncbi:hypothetical protein ACRARG_04760 [Pseudooceanicola sp. C21-150M6]
MTDKFAQKRAMIVTRYIDWQWHFPLGRTMWAQCPQTGRVVDFGRIE